MVARRPLKLPGEPGSYLLWLFLPQGTDIHIGRFGVQHFRRGWYFYAGSAFGPGGLAARLGHHLQSSLRKHWHIDYLKQVAPIRAVWLCRGVNLEHDWAQRLAALPETCYPLKGFGSSDCDCLSHLLYFPTRPAARPLLRVLASATPIERHRIV